MTGYDLGEAIGGATHCHVGVLCSVSAGRDGSSRVVWKVSSAGDNTLRICARDIGEVGDIADFSRSLRDMNRVCFGMRA